MITLSNIPALLALVVGVTVLFRPKLLNTLVAVYLVVVGLVGLNILVL